MDAIQASSRVAMSSQFPGKNASPGGRNGYATPRYLGRHHSSDDRQMLPFASWQDFRSIQMQFSGVPTSINLNDIRKSLGSYGNVVFIDLFDNRQGVKSGRGKVIFEPPPKIDFVTRQQCVIKSSGRSEWRIRIDTVAAAGEGKIRSPLNRWTPSRVDFKPTALHFGVMIDPDSMMVMRSTSKDPISFSTSYSNRMIDITFPLLWGAGARETRHYRFSIKFSQMKSFIRVQKHGTVDWGLVINLPTPPQFYLKVEEASPFPDEVRSWSDQETWHRQIRIADSPLLSKSKVHPISLQQTSPTIDIGRWTVYYLEMRPADREKWEAAEQYFKDFDISCRPSRKFSTRRKEEPKLWQMLGSNMSDGEALALLEDNSRPSMPFAVRYQLEACISQGVLIEHSITYEFLDKLASYTPERARLMLESVTEAHKSLYNPMDMFSDERALNYWPNMRLPSYCAWVRKATITPTTIYFNTPTVETTNRVLREFADLNDRFLRVQFTDELTEGRIYSRANSRRDDELFTRIFRVLRDGIAVGDRHYQFLAFGNSQFRENGAYFFCETDHVTCATIRNWMGKLKHIRLIAKYAARMGQCFSTTRQIRGMNIPNIFPIPDIERGAYNFTDGVGKIPSFLLEMVANDLKLRESPSCIQFRMGGCKGILVKWPDVPGSQVLIRPSQQKFEATYNGLEVIRWSQFSVATLNRQTIPILSCLGVPDQVFEDMMTEQLESYDRAVTDESVAITLLSTFVDENQTSVILAQMAQHGFMQSQEPFMWTMLRLWRSWSIKTLKEKARIVVSKGAFLLGCVDETSTLRGYSEKFKGSTNRDPDELPQIFLQVPDPDAGTSNAYKIITGTCVVGRNPSLHPGDIRVVQAVDVPALRHLKDVVVFPSIGDRDVPSMCSGGDLDGDDFFVFWDERLIPLEWHHEPMALDSSKPEVLGRDVTIADVIQFFVLYMKNDSLSTIAQAHLAQVDRLDRQAKDGICIDLAHLHSVAVDYVKTGQPATMPRRLQPYKWPHFMERRKGSYHSTQILGKLYDRVKATAFTPAYEMPFDQRILQRYKLSDDLLYKARQLKSQYDISVRRLMGQCEVETEFEIWSTFVLKKPRVGTMYKLAEKLGHEVAALKDHFKTACREAAGLESMGRDYDAQKLDPFVAAMYKVTQEEVKIALHEARTPIPDARGRLRLRKVNARSMPLISFPWLFYRELGRIATGKQGAAKGSSSSSTVVDTGKDEKAKQGSSMSEEVLIDEDSRVLDAEEIRAMDYTRTTGGLHVHRGQTLDLFGDEDGDLDFGDDAESDEEDNSRQDETVDDHSGKSEGAGETASQGVSKENGDAEPEFASVEDFDLDDDEEDTALDKLARLMQRI